MRTADMAACSWLVRRMQCRLQRNAPKKRYGRTVLNRRPHQLSTLQLAVRSGGLARSRELTQDVMQDAPVLEVLALLGRVDANTRLELDRRTGLGRGDDGDHLGRTAVETDDLVALLARQAERLRVLAFLEHERQHAHADEIRAMDTLEALGDHRLHAEQHRALGSPVSGRARAVLLASDDDERRAFLLVAHRRVIDAHLLTARNVYRDTAFGAGHEQVA